MIRPWRWAAVSVTALFLVAGLQRWCGPDPAPVLSDTRWRDSLRARELAWELDSALRATEIAATERRADSLVGVAGAAERRSRRLARWADSVAGAPPDAGPDLPEATVPRVAYDSLWVAYETLDSANAALYGSVREYVEAASLYASQAVAATGRYDWAVHTYEARIETLEGALRRQARGCRVLGLLPCPQLHVGYGLTLAGGAVRPGLQVGVSIPIRF